MGAVRSEPAHIEPVEDLPLVEREALSLHTSDDLVLETKQAEMVAPEAPASIEPVTVAEPVVAAPERARPPRTEEDLVRCRVYHGALHHNGVEYPTGAEVHLSASVAARLTGVVTPVE